MADTRKPTEEPQDRDALTTEVSESASEAEPDVQAMLVEAEAEAAEAEAAAAAARAKVRAMRSDREPAPGDAGDDGSRWTLRAGPARWSTVGKLVAVVVIVGSLVGSGVILWQHHNASARRDRAAEFTAEASTAVTAMLSLDFRHAKDDVQRIIDNSTGPFRDDYVTRADSFVKVVEESKVIASGSVTATAVESMGDDEAVVLVAASQQVTNAAGNKQPRVYRFRVTVTRDSGVLKMSKAVFVP